MSDLGIKPDPLLGPRNYYTLFWEGIDTIHLLGYTGTMNGLEIVTEDPEITVLRCETPMFAMDFTMEDAERWQSSILAHLVLPDVQAVTLTRDMGDFRYTLVTCPRSETNL